MIRSGLITRSRFFCRPARFLCAEVEALVSAHLLSLVDRLLLQTHSKNHTVLRAVRPFLGVRTAEDGAHHNFRNFEDMAKPIGAIERHA